MMSKITWLGDPITEVSPEALRAKKELLYWSKLPGVSAPVSDYGNQMTDVFGPWGQRDGRMLAGFSKWWNSNPTKNFPPGPLPEGATKDGVLQQDLLAIHLDALDKLVKGTPVPSAPWATPNQTFPLPPLIPGLPTTPSIPGFPGPLQVVDTVASKKILATWGSTDGKGIAPYTDYGVQAADSLPAWTSRDSAMLNAFSKWRGNLPTGENLALSEAHSTALKTWLAESIKKVPSGWITPTPQPPTPPGPGGSCPTGQTYDPTTKLCQPNLPPAKKTEPGSVWVPLGIVAGLIGVTWFILKK